MLFLNYSEVNMKYLFSSVLRPIVIKQNFLFYNTKSLKLPKIELYFVFDKIAEMDLIKVANNIILLWLLTGKKSYIKKIFSKLHKGVRYYKFVIVNKIDIDSSIYIFLDFMTNTFLYLLEKSDYRKYDDVFKSFFEIKDLEVFSNLKLLKSFYLSKINDHLFLKFYYRRSKNQFFDIAYVLNLLKIKKNE